MSCLGVHFALTDKEVAQLRSLPDDRSRVGHLQDKIEKTYFVEHPNHKAESHESWDAMHRTLADGKLTWDSGEYPLSHVVLGGTPLYSQADYIMSLKTPQQVSDIATALSTMTEGEFRRRYFKIDAESYGLLPSEEDFIYTWDWFEGVRDLYIRANQEGRFVLFTADQ